jgi:hypothetical protein
MRTAITIVLGLAVASPTLAQTIDGRGTAIVPMNRLPTSTAVVSRGAVPVAQQQAFELVASVEHFDVLAAREFEAISEVVGRQVEAAYQAIATSLQHQLSLRPFLVLFGTTDDLARTVQTRTVPGDREHILVPLDLPEARRAGMLAHEVAHVFLWDMLPARRARQLPAWLVEGMAERYRAEWDSGDIATLQAMLQAGSMPSAQALDAALRPGTGRRDHIVGHAMFDLLVARAGADGPRELIVQIGRDSGREPFAAYLDLVGLTPNDFDSSFETFVRTDLLRR